jgi:hypothetical protein
LGWINPKNNIGELIQEMRKDLIDIKEIESTSLTANDIKHQKG